MDAQNIIGISAGVLTAASMLPQLITLIKEKKAKQVSPFAFFILIVGLSLWVWYGIKKNDVPIIYTNMFSLLINISIFILSLVYQNKNKN